MCLQFGTFEYLKSDFRRDAGQRAFSHADGRRKAAHVWIDKAVNTFALQLVKYVPQNLAPGDLYVSEEYAVAVHLCACGCGNKVTTPLGPAEWRFSQRNGLPTLNPSIGNWQIPCRSHYFIADGRVHWSEQWSGARIAAGRLSEQYRRPAYYDAKVRDRGFWARIWALLRELFGL